MQNPSTIYTKNSSVSCQGIPQGGHPLIYLTFDPQGEAVCPYCSAHFIKESAASVDSTPYS